MEDFTKSELQQSGWTAVLHIRKVPLQGSSSVPAESVLVFRCNGEVYTAGAMTISDFGLRIGNLEVRSPKSTRGKRSR